MSVPAMAVEVTLSKAVPITTGTVPSHAANTNPLHTPQPTGQIVVPHDPLGTVNTNTGRTALAAAAYTAHLHPLTGWNGVRTPLNPV